MNHRFNDLAIQMSSAFTGPEIDPRLGRCRSSWYYAHGQCFAYAFLFQKTFGGTICSYATQTSLGREGHCFVFLNGRYYDSEHTAGVVNWKELQSFMKRGKKTNFCRHRSPTAALRRTWYVNAASIALLEKVAAEVKQAYFAKPTSLTTQSSEIVY